MALYMQRFLSTKQTHFKFVRAPLGLKRTISTRLGVGHYKWYQSRPPTLVWGFVWPGVCLFDLTIPWNTMRTLCLHGDVFVMSHIGYGRMFLALYMQRLLLTKQTRFKAVRTPLGPKRTISTLLGASHYKWYQSRSPTPMQGFVWPSVCLFDPTIPWDTMRTLCLHESGVCDFPHRIWENVPSTIYVKAPLYQVDAF